MSVLSADSFTTLHLEMLIAMLVRRLIRPCSWISKLPPLSPWLLSVNKVCDWFVYGQGNKQGGYSLPTSHCKHGVVV